MVSIDDFKEMDIVVGKVTEIKKHPNADKLYLVKVDTGEQEKQVIAGVKEDYSKENLEGKLVILLNNLESATIRGEESQGMILAAQDLETEEISLLTVDGKVTIGSKVS